MIQIGRVIWPGPVGIGAGLVKNGASLVDYGKRADSVEVGSITRHLREGNVDEPKIIWKYPEERAMRHNAGLPNMGAEKAVVELKEAQYQLRVPWGLNVAVTPGLDDQGAVIDIGETVSIMLEGGLRPNWLTLNVSSPDTKDKVEVLGAPARVQLLLQAVKSIVKDNGDMPVWVKVAPNMEEEWAEALGQVLVQEGVEGIVATNTWADPKGLSGGWSGEPLRGLARAAVWQIRRVTGDKIPVVATGGVMEGQHVWDKLAVGAVGVQVVTAALMRGRDAALEIKREYELVVVREARANTGSKNENGGQVEAASQQTSQDGRVEDGGAETGNAATNVVAEVSVSELSGGEGAVVGKK